MLDGVAGEDSRARYLVSLLCLLCVLGGGWISVRLGQDANWDLRNYHWYNPWAFMHDRSDIDLFAAGLQTYFNPLLDLPYYFAAHDWFPYKPRAVAFLMGLPYGLLLFFTLLLTNRVLADLRIESFYRHVLAALAVAFGATGAATFPQIGTTFNEIQISVLVVAGVWLIISRLEHGISNVSRKRMLCSGLLFGLAAGLKFTAAVYAPAAVMALFAVGRFKRRSFEAAILFSFGWAAGFMISYGWWAVHLYEEMSNPMFPMFESVFRTTWLGHGNWMDNQFKPRSVWQAVFYPFQWAHTTQPTVAEPVFSDPRFAVTFIAFALIAAMLPLSGVARRINLIATRETTHPYALPESSRFVLVFVLAGYITWMKMFSILRYTVSIEVMLGLIVAISAIMVVRSVSALNPAKFLIAPFVLLLWSLKVTTVYPEWGRTSYGPSVSSVSPIQLEPDSLVIVLGSPNAYVVPGMTEQNPTAQFAGITDDLLSSRGFDLWKKMTARIGSFRGTRYVLVRGNETARFELFPSLKLAIEEESCRTFSTNIDNDFKLCRLHPAAT